MIKTIDIEDALNIYNTYNTLFILEADIRKSNIVTDDIGTCVLCGGLIQTGTYNICDTCFEKYRKEFGV